MLGIAPLTCGGESGSDGVTQPGIEVLEWFVEPNEGQRLGTMYANGEGVPEDPREAVRWYRLAAEQGYATAQSQLGTMYANGEGVPEDLVLAYMWYNLSAAQGNEIAQSNKDSIAGWRQSMLPLPRVDPDPGVGHFRQFPIKALSLRGLVTRTLRSFYLMK